MSHPHIHGSTFRGVGTLVFLLASIVPVGAQEADPPIQLCPDLLQARKAFLDPAESARRRAHFLTMVQHFDHGFGLATEHLRDPVQRRRLRDESYGEVWANSSAVEFLREQVLRPQDDSWQVSVGAAEILADHADREIVLLLSYAYLVAQDHPKVLPGTGRQLGRALEALRYDPEAEHEVTGALSRLRADLDSERALVRGVAAEALYRAGDVDIAITQLAALLTTKDPELDPLTLVESFQDLLLQPDLDPGIVSIALAVSEQACRDILAADLASEASVMQRVSSRARRFERALDFLCKADRVDDFELLFECYRSPASALLLTIDRLQELRQTLQALRAKVTDTQRRRLDDYFFGLLEVAGARVFELPEVPMNRDERRQWEGTKDLRYNAASYLTELWSEQEDFQRTCEERPDLIFHLENLVIADHNEVTEGADPLYSMVIEKVETRLLSGRLLGLMADKAGHPVTDLDLPGMFLGMVCQEVGAPLRELEAAFDEVRASSSPHIILQIPKVRTPADGYVRDMALVALDERGFEVLEATDILVIRKPSNDREESNR